MLKLELTVFGQVQKFNYRLQVFNYIREHYPQSVGFIKNNSDGSVLLVVCDKLEALKSIREFAINQAHDISIRTTQESIMPIHEDEISRYISFEISES